MSAKSGILMKLADGRHVIQMHKQPLIKQGRVVLHLCDDEGAYLLDATGKPRTLVKTESEVRLLWQGAQFIGYVD